jgi:hypothetical protein
MKRWRAEEAHQAQTMTGPGLDLRPGTEVTKQAAHGAWSAKHVQILRLTRSVIGLAKSGEGRQEPPTGPPALLQLIPATGYDPPARDSGHEPTHISNEPHTRIRTEIGRVVALIS